jgi:hypothetical protein
MIRMYSGKDSVTSFMLMFHIDPTAMLFNTAG